MKCEYRCCRKCPWRMRWALHDGARTKQTSPTIYLTVRQTGDFGIITAEDIKSGIMKLQEQIVAELQSHLQKTLPR